MALIPLTKVANALEEFLAQQTPNTARAYTADVGVYTAWRKAETPVHALQELLSHGIVPARKLVEAYQNKRAARFAQATVRRQISTLRSFVAAARMNGLVLWALELRKARKGTSEAAIATAQRDMGGPTPSELKKIRTATMLDGSPSGIRDRAIFDLGADLMLRRSEIAALNVNDVDLTKGRLRVLGKGQAAPQWIPLVFGARAGLQRWLEHRGGRGTDPLFVGFNRGSSGRHRLSDRAIYEIILRRAVSAGISKRVRPHGLRHSGITILANHISAHGIPVTEGMKVSRHRKVETFLRYVDRQGSRKEELLKVIADATR